MADLLEGRFKTKEGRIQEISNDGWTIAGDKIKDLSFEAHEILKK